MRQRSAGNPVAKVERWLDAKHLRRLEHDRQILDMEGYSDKEDDPGNPGVRLRTSYVRLPEAGADADPKPARILNARGEVVATMDPVTRKRSRTRRAA